MQVDVELEQMNHQAAPSLHIEKHGIDVIDLDALKLKLSETNARLSKLSASRKELTGELKKLQNGKLKYRVEMLLTLVLELVEMEDTKQDLVKKVAATTKLLAHLNKEKARLRIDQSNEQGEQMEVEVDVEELKYDVGEMRKKYQALKATLRELIKSTGSRGHPSLIEQREQTLNDVKSKVRRNASSSD